MGFNSRKSAQYRRERCLNCGHTLKKSDMYCSRCSQLNSDKPLSAIDFFGEFLRSIFVYDSRMRNTLRDLIFRPGVITRNYVRGQRLKYANPFRFFLSVSIIYFLLKSLLTLSGLQNSPDTLGLKFNPPNKAQVSDSLLAAVRMTETDIHELDTVTGKALNMDAYFPETALDTLSWLDAASEKAGLFNDYFRSHKEEEASSALAKLNYSHSLQNRWLYSRVVAFDKFTHNPDAFIRYISAKIPFFLFFFTPIFALSFLLFYSRKRFTYMEHIIFIFHIFSFVFLIMLLMAIPQIFLPGNILSNLLFFVFGPAYFFIALLNFYGDRPVKTILKFLALSVIFNVGFFISVLLFVSLGMAIY